MKKFTFYLLAIIIVGTSALIVSCGHHKKMVYCHDGYSINYSTEWSGANGTLIIFLKDNEEGAMSYGIRLPLQNAATQKLLALIKKETRKILVINDIREKIPGRMWEIEGEISVAP